MSAGTMIVMKFIILQHKICLARMAVVSRRVRNPTRETDFRIADNFTKNLNTLYRCICLFMNAMLANRHITRTKYA